MGVHKGWSVDDYRKWARFGYTMAETARMLGVKPQTVAAMAAKHGIVFDKGRTGRKPAAKQGEE